MGFASVLISLCHVLNNRIIYNIKILKQNCLGSSRRQGFIQDFSNGTSSISATGQSSTLHEVVVVVVVGGGGGLCQY